MQSRVAHRKAEPVIGLIICRRCQFIEITLIWVWPLQLVLLDTVHNSVPGAAGGRDTAVIVLVTLTKQ